MGSDSHRIAGRIGGWLLPVVLSLAAAVPGSKWWGLLALVAAPLFLLAAGDELDWSVRARRFLRGRYWYFLIALLVLGVVLYGPAGWLVREGSLTAALTLSALAGLALVLAWRRAALPGKLETDPDPQGTIAGALDELAEAGDALFLSARPWLVAFALLALAVSALACGWRAPWPSEETHRLFTALHALLIAPLAASYAIRAGSRWAVQARERQFRERLARDEAERAAQEDLAIEPSADATPPEDGPARLYAAAAAGQIDLALELLQSGVDPHALPDPDARDQRTLPMLAAVQSDLRLLRALIQAKIDVNRAHGGLTPLLAAVRDSYHGRPDAVMTLLANGADPRVADAEGTTPLHNAARSLDPGVAALLLDAGALIDAVDKQGQSPLGVACATGNLALATFLLERRARTEPPNGQPALLAAAGQADDDPAAVKLLLKHKARLDARGRLDRSALLVAALAGNTAIVKTLLTAGTDVNARDAQNVTPLLEAARAGHVEVIRALAAHHPDISAADSSGRNALAIACQAAHAGSDVIALLLELGVDRDHAAADGRKPIDYAVAAGRWSHVLLLDPDYTIPASLIDNDEELVDAPPKLKLRLALERERLDSARALLSADSPVIVFDSPADATAFCLDLYPRLAPPALRLLADALPVEACDAQGASLLSHLLPQGAAAHEAIRAMLARGASPSGAGLLASFLAALGPRDKSMEALALELVERGADMFGADPESRTAPLSHALRLGFDRLLETLLARGANPDTRNGNGATALLTACELGNEAQVRLLIRYGAQPSARTCDGQTALGYSLEHGRGDLRRWLEWTQWPLPRRPLRPADLIAAARVGDLFAVRNLLELQLPLNATDAQGCTALLRACGGGHLPVAQLLLERGADATLPASSGATCLSAALSSRNLPVVNALLERGVDPDQRLPGDVTALMVAAALGQTHAARALLAAGADARAVDAHGGGVAHAAAQFGFSATDTSSMLDLWGVFISAGAELDAVNGSGETPLLLLLGAGYEPGANVREDTVLAQVQLLGSHGIKLTAQDRRGFGPLHLAALHGMGRVVRALLDLGANPEQRDAINRRPSEIALMRGFVDIAHEFAPTRATPSIARFLRNPEP